MLTDLPFAVGEDVLLNRGKHKGSLARILTIDVYQTYRWTGQRYDMDTYVGYNCEVGTELRRYRRISLSHFALSEEDLAEAKVKLMATYQELVGE